MYTDHSGKGENASAAMFSKAFSGKQGNGTSSDGDYVPLMRCETAKGGARCGGVQVYTRNCINGRIG